MFADIARRSGLVFVLFALVATTFLAACEYTGIEGEVRTPVPDKPIVTVLQPENGSAVAPDARVPVRAIIEAPRGITGIQVRVNDSLVDDISLVVSTRRFDYQRDLKLSGLGQHVISLVVTDATGVAGDPVRVVVNVSAAVATPAATATGTSSPTPFVINVGGTGSPTPTATRTPYVVYWTATPRPSATSTPTVYVIYVTATAAPTVTPTLAR